MMEVVLDESTTAPSVRGWTDMNRTVSLFGTGHVTRRRSSSSSPTLGSGMSKIIEGAMTLRTGDAAAAFVLLTPLLAGQPVDSTERAYAAGLGVLLVASVRTGDVASSEATLRALDTLDSTRGTRLPLALMRESDLAEVEEAIPDARAVFDRMLLSDATPVADHPDVPVLSAAQRRVLRVLAEEESLAIIASRLSLSRNTVKSHLRSIYRDLGATGRQDALLRAARAGLMGWPE